MKGAVSDAASRVLLFVHRPPKTCRPVSHKAPPRSAYSVQRGTLAARIRLGEIPTAGVSKRYEQHKPTKRSSLNTPLIINDAQKTNLFIVSLAAQCRRRLPFISAARSPASALPGLAP